MAQPLASLVSAYVESRSDRRTRPPCPAAARPRCRSPERAPARRGGAAREVPRRPLDGAKRSSPGARSTRNAKRAEAVAAPCDQRAFSAPRVEQEGLREPFASVIASGWLSTPPPEPSSVNRTLDATRARARRVRARAPGTDPPSDARSTSSGRSRRRPTAARRPTLRDPPADPAGWPSPRTRRAAARRRARAPVRAQAAQRARSQLARAHRDGTSALRRIWYATDSPPCSTIGRDTRKRFRVSRKSRSASWSGSTWTT